MNKTLEAIMRKNVRVPDQVMGDLNAQFSVGQDYLEGRGVEVQLPVNERLSKAARWFRRSADQIDGRKRIGSMPSGPSPASRTTVSPEPISSPIRSARRSRPGLGSS